MAEVSKPIWIVFSDGSIASDKWTAWIKGQDIHFNHSPKTLYYADIPIAIFVGICLFQIAKNL